MTEVRTQTWGSLYSLAMGNAAAHRATGVAKARDRGQSLPSPLPRYVTADTAHDGFADKLLSEVPAYRLTFQKRPTTRLCGLLVGSAIWHQSFAALSPSVAVTGVWSGRKSNHEATLDECHVTAEPLAAESANEELAAILASMPKGIRATAKLLMDWHEQDVRNIDGSQKLIPCPDGIAPQVWWKRCERARQALRTAWHRRQEKLDGLG